MVDSLGSSAWMEPDPGNAETVFSTDSFLSHSRAIQNHLRENIPLLPSRQILNFAKGIRSGDGKPQ